MEKKTLKQSIVEAAEHYERHAEYLRKRAERATNGSDIQREMKEMYQFNRGRAKAMREALEYIEEFIG